MHKLLKSTFKRGFCMIQAIFAYIMYFIFWILPIDFASFLGGKIGELLGKLLTVTNIAIKNLQKYA